MDSLPDISINKLLTLVFNFKYRGRSTESLSSTATPRSEDNNDWSYPSNPTRTLVEYVNKLKDASHRENLKFIEPADTK